MSDRADRYASAAAGSALVGVGGGAAWAKGRSRRTNAVVQGAATRNYPAIRRAGLDARSEADAALEQGKVAGDQARRRRGLAARTRSRLSEVSPGRFVEPGRKGFYPSNRLKALEAAAERDDKAMTGALSRFTQQSADSRARLAQATRMESGFAGALRDFGRAKRTIRGGKIATAAGVAGAVGFGAAAERAKGKRGKKATPVELKRIRPNVVDLDRYRNTRTAADERGSLLIDPQGYRKPLSANAGAAWLKNHGRPS